jgi:hypothetical protein
MKDYDDLFLDAEINKAKAETISELADCLIRKENELAILSELPREISQA